MKKRHILSQGDLDGACFLYSIVNAYVSLTSRKPGKNGWDNSFYKRWDNATSFIPYLSDFFICAYDNEYGGTGRYSDDPRLFAATTERVLEQLATGTENGRFTVIMHAAANRPEALSGLVDQESVVLVCPNTEHWVVCVQCDTKPYVVWTACSWKYHLFRDYKEVFRKSNNVYSNNRLSPSCEFPFSIQVKFKV